MGRGGGSLLFSLSPSPLPHPLFAPATQAKKTHHGNTPMRPSITLKRPRTSRDCRKMPLILNSARLSSKTGDKFTVDGSNGGEEEL